MAHPYQCLLYCHRPKDPISQILVAAGGSYLHVFDVLNGQNLCSWSPTSGLLSPSPRNKIDNLFATKNHVEDDAIDGLQPSAKRRKTSPAPIVSTESSSTEILVDNDESGKDLHFNPIIKLAGTSAGHHIIAATGEDKCLRVFELAGDGIIKQISERLMPKRLCTITVSSDDTTILCGDKFGDVYAIPLLGRPLEPQNASGPSENGLASKPTQKESKYFEPSASSLTVHTKRNLNALKQQQQRIPNHEKVEKKSLNFEHKLLIGHVSLLTDLTCAMIPCNSRNYILTSDRDEHIRVSRGIPQTHITVGYCQGHTEFVSKLCILPWRPDLLVTGGGDDFLIMWDWLAGTIKQRIDLSGIINDFKRLTFSEADPHTSIDNAPFAVSNILPLEFDGNEIGEKWTELVVTCEGMPALFLFTINAHDEIEFRETYTTKGNVIDMVVLSDQRSVICSMDNIHLPFSTVANNPQPTSSPLIDAIHLSNNQQWEQNSDLYGKLAPALEDMAKKWPVIPPTNAAKGKILNELLYGLENLRKHRIGDNAGTDRAADEEDVE